MYQKRANNFNSKSILIQAAEEGDIRAAAEAISFGKFSDDEYRAALMKSAGHGHVDLTKALANHKANNNYANVAAARLAAQYGREEIFYFFINEKNVNLDIQDGLFVSVAAQFGKANILHIIKSLGFDFTQCSNMAFQNACKYLHDEAACFLVNEGMSYLIDPNGPKDNSFDAHKERQSDEPFDNIYRMASRGDQMLKTFEALIKKDLPFENLCIAMVRAASYGQIKLLELLTNNGADINYNKVAALSESARFNQCESIDFIMKMKECDKRIGLQRALKKANDYAQHKPEEGQKLIFKIIDNAILSGDSGICANSMMIRCLNGKQWSAALEMLKHCHWLSKNDDIMARIIKFSKDSELLKYALGEAFDFDSRPWTDIAIEYGNFDNAKLLLEQGIDIKYVDEALINSAKFGSTYFTELCLQMGADIKYKESASVNLACQYNQTNVENIFADMGEYPTEESKLIAAQNEDEVKISGTMSLPRKNYPNTTSAINF